MTDNLVVTSSAAPTAQDPDGASVPPPAWIVPTLVVKEGRDPLGLQTTTQDRLMPLLLPGPLELSQRARYLSFPEPALQGRVRRPERGRRVAGG